MPDVTRPLLHHLALTVTDLESSVRWYGAVFDIHPILELPHEGGVGKILADADRELIIALHEHGTNDGELFTETATGLDHAGFTLPSRADLEAWQEHLEANGVMRSDAADKPLTQSPIADEPYASVLVFRDQDNIQLEFRAPATR
jgi:glyoxylase I family protein